MTNEQIVEAAKSAEMKTEFGELVHSKVSRGVNSAYGIGFLEGAEWARGQLKPSRFHPGDWVVYDGPLGHGIFQVKDVVDGRYTFVDNDSTLLEEDSDKFLRPLTPKDVEGKQKPSAEEVLTKAGLKPYKDGNQWCILAGDNLQEGICGFGDTIEDALYEFLMDVLKTQQEQKPLTTEETELNSIAFLEQMGYTCIPPVKEQKPAEPRKRNKPKESWLSKTKYEIEHADELLIQRQEELREIRELKQKEQKPAEWTSKDWNMLCDICGYISGTGSSSGITNKERETWLRGLPKRFSLEDKEQKPVEKQDYSGLNDFERAIHRGFLSAGVENVSVTIIKETAKECLAQMKPAEWSKEDEEMLTELLLTIEPSNNYDEMRNWLLLKLKSLLLQGSKDSLQTHWKPSEEQKEALEYVIRDYREDGCNATANYLQEILDHLKNM